MAKNLPLHCHHHPVGSSGEAGVRDRARRGSVCRAGAVRQEGPVTKKMMLEFEY